MTAIDATRAWVERFVLGHDLCPFAHEPVQAGTVRYLAATSRDFDDAVRAALGEVLHLHEHPEVETTLVIYERGFETFEELLDAAGALEHLVQEAGLDDELQVVAFHPHFRFAESEAQDPGNAVNRSPHPMLHLLRAASVRRAIERHPDPEGIATRNAAKLRALESG